ncbi:protease modulator HflC [Alienimonas chondri]|uniref:Protein HflC n=1 Tax=Alienimonas chondri TaxID=2681879 RepID=A0ABX1VA47_9PLAN|nr:protease modulator HflC [Alienimonas chondri]NNJ24870.1 Modulator of FtsH protease HflC [Alienimonas chondri]
MNRRRSSLAATALAGAAALVVVLLVLLYSSAYTVDEREYAVVVQFGEPVASRTEPGLYWKYPFIEDVRRLPRTFQFYRTGESDKLKDLPTADARKIEVSAYAVWRITDPMEFLKVLRTVENAENRVIRTRVRSEIRNVVTGVDLAEAVRSTNRELTYSFGSQGAAKEEQTVEGEPAALGEVTSIEIGREKLTERIRQGITARLTGEEGEPTLNRGVELVDVGISSIEFVPDVRRASFDRFRTELESYATANRTSGERLKQEILNATEAEVQKIEGDGERQSKEIRGTVDARNIKEFAAAITETGDFYSFQKKLELYRTALSGDTRLILTTDSDLLGMLKRLEAADAAPDPESDSTIAETAEAE